ncbi:branched-chain amino acid ABC transporter permease [Ferrovibrio sp.]|uniref:branched-chain amino acid ABC transporter permease n=1 Tax=Ferrovibrio sp. TaxID=1917215 RepID=UPI000CBA4DDB|nr:branched-chain amino acid ABC transporter permease [Ferrovibrio sp.]PJI43512.1 MAG: branched-chain amino acid ABC transporter permease [Ferrovibrio sp.]
MITLSDIPARSQMPLTLPMGIFVVVMATAPFWLARVGLYQYLGVEIAIWVLFAMGFNLLFGYTGLHSFGHGAYLGIGAYAFGLFQHHAAISLWGGLFAAIAAASVAGAVVGAFLSHRRGIYYALLTIGFGQVFWFSAMKLHWLTGGEDGLLNIPRPDLVIGPWRFDLNDNAVFYWFVAAITIAAVLLMWRVVNAPVGRVLQAIRQNETRARFVGYDVWRWKWLAFTISAAFAGLAGGLFSMAQQSAYPDVMSLHQSGIIVMMVLVGGGLVSFWGPVLGVVLYFVARDVLGGLTEAWLLWYGLLFVIMVMVRPEGMAGLLHVLLRRTSGQVSTVKPEKA